MRRLIAWYNIDIKSPTTTTISAISTTTISTIITTITTTITGRRSACHSAE